MSHGSDRAPHTGQVTDLATSIYQVENFCFEAPLVVCLPTRPQLSGHAGGVTTKLFGTK